MVIALSFIPVLFQFTFQGRRTCGIVDLLQLVYLCLSCVGEP
jgi:hypothetical protein